MESRPVAIALPVDLPQTARPAIAAIGVPRCSANQVPRPLALPRDPDGFAVLRLDLGHRGQCAGLPRPLALADNPARTKNHNLNLPMDAQQTPVRILHLSDFHFSVGRHWDADPILRELAAFIGQDIAGNGLTPDLVVITGDLAQSGKPEEYDLARTWLENQLWPRLADPNHPLPRDRLLLVPGNHDVDWARIGPAAKDAHQVILKAKHQDAVTDRLRHDATRQLLIERHAAYQAFHGDWLGQPQPLPWWQRSLTIQGQRLHIAGLDSAWLAARDDDSRLVIGTYQINQTALHRDADADHDWRIALLHHPWDSLAELDRTEAKRTLHRRRDLILRGHLHEPDPVRLVPPDPKRSCVELAAGCCYSGKSYPNAFQWIELYGSPRRLRVLFRQWNRHDWDVDRNQPGCPDGTWTLDLDEAGQNAPATFGPAGSMPNATARTSSALPIWQEKLDYLRVQQAICSDPAQKFTLRKLIEEAEAKLRDLD